MTAALSKSVTGGSIPLAGTEVLMYNGEDMKRVFRTLT